MGEVGELIYPERIWAWEIDHEFFPSGYYSIAEVDDSEEYIRADMSRKAVCAKLKEVVDMILAESKAHRENGFLDAAQSLNMIAGDVLEMQQAVVLEGIKK